MGLIPVRVQFLPTGEIARLPKVHTPPHVMRSERGVDMAARFFCCGSSPVLPEGKPAGRVFCISTPPRSPPCGWHEEGRIHEVLQT